MYKNYIYISITQTVLIGLNEICKNFNVKYYIKYYN